MNAFAALEPAACAELLRTRGPVVALTGAGVSTAAGIPDFRGPRGLYVTRRYDPEKVFEIASFRREPAYFYEFSNDFVTAVGQVEPTFTHRFLAQLERTGLLQGVVTQNIDLLHRLAGSRSVIELHGSYTSATCIGCSKRFRDLTYDWWDIQMRSSPTPPVCRCPDCGAVLKPDIVFFGEMVPAYRKAEDLVSGSGLLLILGSSLQVSPASYLAHCTSGATIVINRGDVMLAAAHDRYFVDADLDEYLRNVADHLGLNMN